MKFNCLISYEWMFYKGDCSIQVSWSYTCSFHSSQCFIQILHTAARTYIFLIFISAVCLVCMKASRFSFTKIDHTILTQVAFTFISLWSFSQFISNYEKALLRWLPHHPHAKLQLIYPLVWQQINLVLHEQLVITPEISIGFAKTTL